MTTKEPRFKRNYKSLTKTEKKQFYKLMITHSFAEAAAEIGLDQSYAPSSLRSVGYQIYKALDPEELGFAKDTVELVQNAVNERKINHGKRTVLEKPDEPEPTELIDYKDTKAVAMGGRNKAAMLLHKKMDMINKSKKALEKENIATLAKVYGIMFDKAQIVQGQATENIAVMAKIDDGLSADETLDMILNMREQEVAEKADN